MLEGRRKVGLNIWMLEGGEQSIIRKNKCWKGRIKSIESVGGGSEGEGIGKVSLWFC